MGKKIEISHSERLTGSLHVPVQCDSGIRKGNGQVKTHGFTNMAPSFLSLDRARRNTDSVSAPHGRFSVSGAHILSVDFEAL